MVGPACCRIARLIGYDAGMRFSLFRLMVFVTIIACVCTVAKLAPVYLLRSEPPYWGPQKPGDFAIRLIWAIPTATFLTILGFGIYDYRDR